MSKVFYELDAEKLTATLWLEGKEKEKETVKGKWQKYSGARASKNNTRIIFDKLPAFCDPQKTLTLDPNEPKSSFIPKLNTKTNTGNYTRKALFEYVKAVELAEYLEKEEDKKTFSELLEKAKQVFDKKQNEKMKTGVQNVISGLEKMGLSKDDLLALLTAQIEEAKKAKAEEEKAKAEEENTENTENTEKQGAKNE